MTLYAPYIFYTTANVVKITSSSTNDDNLQHRGMLKIRVGIFIVRLMNVCLPLLSKLLLCKGYHINTQCGHI